jgi:hypothetical protein
VQTHYILRMWKWEPVPLDWIPMVRSAAPSELCPFPDNAPNITKIRWPSSHSPRRPGRQALSHCVSSPFQLTRPRAAMASRILVDALKSSFPAAQHRWSRPFSWRLIWHCRPASNIKDTTHVYPLLRSGQDLSWILRIYLNEEFLIRISGFRLRIYDVIYLFLIRISRWSKQTPGVNFAK